MSRARKGPQYERHLCRVLSLWWTNEKDDGVFWRSDSSGARATRRMQSGKRTHGQHGDIQAIDPIGHPLIRLVAIEIKRGYASATTHDLLDRADGNCAQLFDKWIDQTIRAHENADTRAWWLITKRDQREPLIFMPSEFFRLCDVREEVERPHVHLNIEVERNMGGGRIVFEGNEVTGCRFNAFLNGVTPKRIMKIAKAYGA